MITDVTKFSDEYYHLFGFADNESATREDCFGRIHPDDKDAVSKAVNDAIHSNDKYSIEYCINLPDGQKKYIHGMGEVERDKNNKPIRFFGTVHNITERKNAENLLIKARDKLEQNVEERTSELRQSNIKLIEANKVKSQFLTHMSHELRTPMNAILGFAQMLELDVEGFTEIQRGNVNEILDAGYHLLALINDVLDLAKIESGKLEVFIKEVSLDDVLHQCITLVQSLAEARQVKIIDHISSKGYKLQADFTRIKQVLLNLLSNAVKYNRDNGGSITLDSEIIDTQRLRISVTDTGKGLSAVDVAKLFTPFERLDEKYNIEGTGIGLIITKHLIELMGGVIGVESVQGEDTTFWVELALSPEA
ncbi:MAG: ATP-binding protein [Methylococcales bacterium]